jgi:hypothetical protein
MFMLDTLIDVFGVRIAEQELELHFSDSTIRKITFAVEPRQLALDVRVTLCCVVATYIDPVVDVCRFVALLGWSALI